MQAKKQKINKNLKVLAKCNKSQLDAKIYKRHKNAEQLKSGKLKVERWQTNRNRKAKKTEYVLS